MRKTFDIKISNKLIPFSNFGNFFKKFNTGGKNKKIFGRFFQNLDFF